MNKIIFQFFLFSSYIFAETEPSISNNPNILLNYIFPLISAIIIGIIVGYFSNRWSSKSQLEHYKITSKDEKINKWIYEFKTLFLLF